MIGLRIPKGSGHGFCLNLRTNFPAERKGRIEHRVTPGDSFNLTNSPVLYSSFWFGVVHFHAWGRMDEGRADEDFLPDRAALGRTARRRRRRRRCPVATVPL